MFENPRRDRQAKKFDNKCSENSRSQIVFRTDFFPKIDVGCPWRAGKWLAETDLTTPLQPVCHEHYRFNTQTEYIQIPWSSIEDFMSLMLFSLAKEIKHNPKQLWWCCFHSSAFHKCPLTSHFRPLMLVRTLMVRASCNIISSKY